MGASQAASRRRASSYRWPRPSGARLSSRFLDGRRPTGSTFAQLSIATALEIPEASSAPTRRDHNRSADNAWRWRVVTLAT
jgi:hypothetical protein